MSPPANIPPICLLDRILDLVWPRRCEICSRPVDRPRRHVCSDCLNRLPFAPVNGCCRRCGRDAVGLDGEFLCEECRTSRPLFDRAASALRFEGDARDIIVAFKFTHHAWMRDDLVDWLEAAVRARFVVGEIDCIAPVPSTLLRRLDRGYSQCGYIASALAKRLGRRYDARALRRTGSPRAQVGLSAEDRRANVVGTFACRRRFSGETVLVVDDVMTTGSTLSECAKVLKESGAGRVWCATLARSLRT